MCFGIVLAWAAITEHHMLGGLKNGSLFLMVLDLGSSVIKVLISLVSGEGCHFGLQMATLSLSVHMAFPWWIRVGRGGR